MYKGKRSIGHLLSHVPLPSCGPTERGKDEARGYVPGPDTPPLLLLHVSNLLFRCVCLCDLNRLC